MEDDASTPNTLLESLSENTLDFDLMDELLCDGYWLETIEGSNFWQPGFSISSDLNFSSSCVSTSEANMDQFVPKPHQQNNQEGRERSDFGDNQPLVYPQMNELVQSQTRNWEVILAKASSGQSENFLVGSTEMNKRLWIAPRVNPSPHSSVRNRLMLAVEYLRELTKDSDVLIQMWLPIRKEGKQILITDNQPSSFNPNSKSLASYRDVSKRYHFAAEENSDDFPGMPGRVFLKKLPEWTPDVRFFRRDEYPRVIYAQQCNVSGSLALPVFERESGTCLGVVEIVTTTQKIKYRLELENICKALEAVDLRSSENSCPIIVKACDNSYQAALAEIQEFLISVCNTHGLPLAQTWVPCIERGKPGCRHSNENNPLCISTVDSACYIRDEKVLPFHEACSEHQLLIGEGIVGRAFTTNQPCFATDITAISKTDYPLSHYAKMFQLCGSVAIRLRSIYTGTNDFVLEFFLPYECKDGEEQRQMWRLLTSEIQRGCRSLRVVTDYELERENRVPSSGKIAESDHKLDSTFFKEHSQEELSYIGHLMEAQPKGKAASISLGYQKEEIGEDFKETTHWEYANIHQDTGSKGIVESGRDFCFIRGQHQSGVRKPSEKRRTKTLKTISLQVLRQYFAGSLKDAAKSIGVCPTTLKRICRQHGITRWPSRKIKKVGHSLRKLQLVIDSVQGVEGAIQLNSFYSNFPELSSPNIPNTSSTLKMDDQLKPFGTQLEASLLSPVTTTSKSPSSSCNQSSSSSYCCSTEAKPPPVSTSFPEQPNGVLKRVSSNIELHGSSQEERKLLVRSHSHKILSELPNTEALPPFSNLRGPLSKVGSGFRVKANFGEEKFRFTLQQNWGFGDIRKEIVKRFHIDENCKIDLKYLDDDSDWVLLTCDADLEECIDIHRSTTSQTIKISVHQAFNSTLGSSFGSSGPS